MRARRAASGILGAVSVAALALAVMPSIAAGPVDAGADARPPPPKPIPADPTPMNERMQWVFVLRWARGEVYLVAVHKTDMGEPHPSARVMGRFALELFEGPTLIERVRFDFPGLGAEEVSDGGFRAPVRILTKLDTRIGVFFPATKRGTRLELWDRATNHRWPLPWPPTEGAFSDGLGDGGTLDASGPIPSN